MFKYSSHILILFLYTIGCSFERGAKDDSVLTIPDHLKNYENLSVVEEAADGPNTDLVWEKSFGDTDEVWIGRVSDFAVDDSGRVFVGDGARGHCRVHVYSPDGEHLAQFGGYGRGPGEFLRINNMDIAGDHLYIYDPDQLRISVFSLETLSLEETLILNLDNWISEIPFAFSYPQTIHPRSDGLFLAGFSEQFRYDDDVFLDRVKEEGFLSVTYYLIDRDGKILREESERVDLHESFPIWIQPFRGSNSITGFPFQERVLITFSDDDRILVADSGEFLIKLLEPDGTYLQAFYHPFDKAPLDQEQTLSRYSNRDWPDYHAVRSMELPSTWPAIQAMVADDQNRLWIATYTDSDEVFEWLVINEAGLLVGRFILPGSRWDLIPTRALVKGNYFFISESNSSDRRIVRYRIDGAGR